MSSFISKLGPGLLYAGAAVGVSHLIQSTRAGADYGMLMIAVVIIANVLKYPFFKAGPIYTTLSGKSLLEGFYELGKGPIILFYSLTILTMFIVLAVVALITAGVFGNIFHFSYPLWQLAALILLICAIILFLGRFQMLNKMMRIVILLLTLTTLLTLIAASLNYSPPNVDMRHFDLLNDTDIFFLIALIGWMPAPLDIALWHSEWTLEENLQLQTKDIKRANFDFKVGYWGTTFLAIAFVALGSLMLRGRGVILPDSGVAFAGEVIGMYTKAIGDWAFIIVALAALTTMFSTTLTVLDAYPRVLSKAIKLSFPKRAFDEKIGYGILLTLIILGALFVLVYQMENMKQLVDLATSVSFLTAPILASIIFMIVQNYSQKVFSRLEKGLAISGLIFLYAFAIYYLWVKYF